MDKHRQPLRRTYHEQLEERRAKSVDDKIFCKSLKRMFKYQLEERKQEKEYYEQGERQTDRGLWI